MATLTLLPSLDQFRDVILSHNQTGDWDVVIEQAAFVIRNGRVIDARPMTGFPVYKGVFLLDAGFSIEAPSADVTTVPVLLTGQADMVSGKYPSGRLIGVRASNSPQHTLEALLTLIFDYTRNYPKGDFRADVHRRSSLLMNAANMHPQAESPVRYIPRPELDELITLPRMEILQAAVTFAQSLLGVDVLAGQDAFRLHRGKVWHYEQMLWSWVPSQARRVDGLRINFLPDAVLGTLGCGVALQVGATNTPDFLDGVPGKVHAMSSSTTFADVFKAVPQLAPVLLDLADWIATHDCEPKTKAFGRMVRGWATHYTRSPHNMQFYWIVPR